jgi:hypothetical protein
MSDNTTPTLSGAEVEHLRRNYILCYGVLTWGWCMACTQIRNVLQLPRPVPGHPARDILAVLLVCLLGGYVVGMIMWAYGKEKILEGEIKRRSETPGRVPIKKRSYRWALVSGLIGLALVTWDVHVSLVRARDYLTPLTILGSALVIQGLTLYWNHEEFYRWQTTRPTRNITHWELIKAIWPTELLMLIMFILPLRPFQLFGLMLLYIGPYCCWESWAYHRSWREFGNARHRENPATTIPNA